MTSRKPIITIGVQCFDTTRLHHVTFHPDGKITIHDHNPEEVLGLRLMQQLAHAPESPCPCLYLVDAHEGGHDD